MAPDTIKVLALFAGGDEAFLEAAVSIAKFGAFVRNNPIPFCDSKLLEIVRPPLSKSPSEKLRVFERFAQFCRDRHLDQSIRSLFAFLHFHRNDWTTETHDRYKRSILDMFVAKNIVSPALCTVARSIPVRGRARHPTEILSSRDARVIDDSLFEALLKRSPFHGIVLTVLHSRIGLDGDARRVTPDRITPSPLHAHAWRVNLLGITKATSSSSTTSMLERSDHVVTCVYPPAVCKLMAMAASGVFGPRPLAPPDELSSYGHRLKHTATRLLANVLAGSPYAEKIADIAAHHISAVNPRRTRNIYLGMHEIELELVSSGAFLGLSLLAHRLATIVGLVSAFSQQDVDRISAKLRIGELMLP